LGTGVLLNKLRNYLTFGGPTDDTFVLNIAGLEIDFWLTIDGISQINNISFDGEVPTTNVLEPSSILLISIGF
jgi:hypothetical protein